MSDFVLISKVLGQGPDIGCLSSYSCHCCREILSPSLGLSLLCLEIRLVFTAWKVKPYSQFAWEQIPFNSPPDTVVTQIINNNVYYSSNNLTCK